MPMLIKVLLLTAVLALSGFWWFFSSGRSTTAVSTPAPAAVEVVETPAAALEVGAAPPAPQEAGPPPDGDPRATAESLVRERKFEQALATLEGADGTDPEGLSAMSRLLRIIRDTEATQEGVEWLATDWFPKRLGDRPTSAGPAQDPADPFPAQAAYAGKFLAEQGSAGQAMELLSQVLERSPDHSSVRTTLAEAILLHQALDQVPADESKALSEKSIALLQKALEQADDPYEELNARHRLADQYTFSGRLDEAEAEFQKLMADPAGAASQPQIYFEAGFVALQRGDQATANERFRETVETWCDLAEAQPDRGIPFPEAALVVLDELQGASLDPALMERVKRLRTGSSAWAAGSWQFLAKILDAGRDASPTRAKTILAMMDRADKLFASADDPYLRCSDYLVYARHLITIKISYARYLAYEALGDEPKAMEQVAKIESIFPGHPMVAERVARGFAGPGGPVHN